MEQSSETLSRAARIAGLRSFDTPSLEAVERRRLQLWTTTLLLLVTVAATVIALLFLPERHFPPWLTPATAQAGLMGLVLLFCFYALEKELQLRGLTRQLVDEKVLTAALTNRLREVSSLLEAGKAINLDLSLDEVVATILRCARELLGGHDCSIQLRYGPSDLRTVSVAGDSAADGAQIRIGEGIAGRVAESREPVLIEGVLEDRPGRTKTAHPPISAMSVPLIHRDSLLGVLNINAGPGRRYSRHDLRAFGLFGEHAAIAIANAQLYEAQRLSASQTSYHAMHDALTGLPNRALFLDRLKHALEQRRSPDSQIAVLFLDLDNFKRVNDSLGHAAGDDVLVAFAERLRESTRAADTVARFGGDEFAVLMDEVTATEQASQTAARIVGSLRQAVSVSGRGIRIGASVGIAVERADDLGPDELLRHADTALRVAKTRGKGALVVFEPSMLSEALHRLDLEADLEEALARGEIDVHFQPIFRLSPVRLVAAEALVRWHHPHRGLLPASTWVPLAEQARLLTEIDRFVLKQACTVGAGLGNGARGLTINVNLSPSRLQEPAITEEVGAVLEETGLPAERLALEITERAIVRDAASIASNLSQLHRLGVRVALDDFGTGYSSLSHLRRFPVDTVKIDRAFVEELTSGDGNGRSLVEAIVRLGHGLNLDVIAEGVERQDQLDILCELGCGLAQGYLLGEPMPIDEFEALTHQT